MSENPMTTCLFIGGTADGQRLSVKNTYAQQRIRSRAGFIHEPHPHADGDPRPETTSVVETYLPCEAIFGKSTEMFFALNALSDHAINMQLVKHFGADAFFRRSAVTRV